jgi:hypothetical protein
MDEETQSPPNATFACPTCGALYEVTLQYLSLRDKDRASCFVCRRVMVEWDTNNVPFFRLIRKPDQHRQ